MGLCSEMRLAQLRNLVGMDKMAEGSILMLHGSLTP